MLLSPLVSLSRPVCSFCTCSSQINDYITQRSLPSSELSQLLSYHSYMIFGLGWKWTSSEKYLAKFFFFFNFWGWGRKTMMKFTDFQKDSLQQRFRGKNDCYSFTYDLCWLILRLDTNSSHQDEGASSGDSFPSDCVWVCTVFYWLMCEGGSGPQ